MSLHQNSNDRRRRVLNEELNSALQSDTASSTIRVNSASGVRKIEKYTEAAQMQNQPRVTDLIPSRYLTISLLGAAGVILITVLEIAYAFLPQIIPPGLAGPIDLLDLQARTSLATWFSSVMLLLSSLTALLIFSLRRAKVDDYKGRYRIWIWAAMGCLAMSIDETAGIRHAYQLLMVHLTGNSLYADGQAWWIATWSGLMLLIGVRLTLDARACRGSTSLFVLAAMFWSGVCATRLGFNFPNERDAVMLTAGLQMTAYLTLLLAMSLHARHIILDVQGLLPADTSKPKKQLKVKKSKMPVEETDAEILKMEPARKQDRRTDLDPPAPARPIKKAKEAPAAQEKPKSVESQPPMDVDDLLEPSGGHKKMSRADRKRLRREESEHRKAG